MAAIGRCWADGAWVEAGWADGAWSGKTAPVADVGGGGGGGSIGSGRRRQSAKSSASRPATYGANVPEESVKPDPKIQQIIDAQAAALKMQLAAKEAELRRLRLDIISDERRTDSLGVTLKAIEKEIKDLEYRRQVLLLLTAVAVDVF